MGHCCKLGNFQNKKIFIENQKAVYPDFSSWKTDENPNDLKKKIAEQSLRLKIFFDKQEKLAFLRQELSQLATEHKYFNQYVDKSNVNTDKIKFKKNYHQNNGGVVAGISVNFRKQKENKHLV